MSVRFPHILLVIALLSNGLVNSLPAAPAAAALPPEVRKELGELQKELREVVGLVRRKQTDDAKALIKKVDDRLKELMIPDEEKDRAYSSLRIQLEKARASIPVSFERDVAPILKTNCLGCHGDDRDAGNLRMNSYANMARGGSSGLLAVPGRPMQSLMIAKLLTSDEQQRMPKDSPKLGEADVRTIYRWVEQGAHFDGEDRDAPIGDSTIAKKPPVKVEMATGSETVSFKNDIAPYLVQKCMGCHSGRNPRGEFSMNTFELLLSGGKTGSTIVPGNPDDSYIVDLVLRQVPIKMPAGNVESKRSEAVALETWIREGARFDGSDPKATIRSMVPTEAEKELARLAAMSDQEMEERRLEQAATIWKRVSPRDAGITVTTENLVVHGNSSESRLKQMGDWGESHLTILKEKYPLPAGQKPWRGRLIVFVAKDRFDYEEFNMVLMDGRRTPKTVSGHATITPNFNEVYIALHDTGDDVSADNMTAQQLMNALLSEAYLNRDGATLPDWLRQGFGTMEAGLPPDSEFARAIPVKARNALSTMTEPAKIFNDGTFSPDETGPVGYMLVRFLLKNGGMPGLRRLVSELRQNPDVPRAIQQTYGNSPASLGQAFLRSGAR